MGTISLSGNWNLFLQFLQPTRMNRDHSGMVSRSLHLHQLADKAVLHLDKQTVKFQLTLRLYSERPCLQARPGEGFAAQHNFFSSITSFRSH